MSSPNLCRQGDDRFTAFKALWALPGPWLSNLPSSFSPLAHLLQPQ